MNDAAFLDAIAEAPDDDLTRLAYADWLEENGDGDRPARAELIRVQCEADRLPEWDRRRGPLLRRAKKLIKEHGRAWLPPAKKGLPRKKWTFRRGFVDYVETKASSFEREAKQLFEAAPLLRAVRFPEASNEIAFLLESPLVARLTEIDLSQMCTCGGCRIGEEQRLLFASPLVAGLRVLRLQGNRVDDETARALAESPHLANLRNLDLSNNRISEAGMRDRRYLLIGGRDVTCDNRLGEAGLHFLAMSPHRAGLTELNLSGNLLGPAGFRALGEGRWPALKVLRLGECRMSGNALSRLARSPVLDPVRMLDLWDNWLSNTSALALVRSRHLGNIEWLDLGFHVKFRTETIQALKVRFGKKVRLG